MRRLWYKDGTYMDLSMDCAWEYESDPEWDHTEDLDGDQDEDGDDEETRE